MDARLRDRFAITIALVAFALGAWTLVFGRFDPGVRLAIDRGQVIVRDVNDHSIAREVGLRPGMTVIRLGGVTLIELPQYIYPAVEPTPDPGTGETPPSTPLGIEPAKPTAVSIDPGVLEKLVAEPVSYLEAIEPWDLEQGTVENGWSTVAINDVGRSGIRETLPSVLLGAVLLALVGWWLASGRGGEALRTLAIPLAVATATPFIVRPLEATWSPPLVALDGVLTAVAMVPLAVGLIERIEVAADRRLLRLVAAACAVGAILLAVAVAGTEPWSGEGLARWALVGAIPLVPGLAAAGPIQPGGLRGAATSSGRLLESTEFAVAGATPLMAVATDQSPYLFPLVVWIALVLAAGRFTVRPLARLASRATLQRDLVVAATEAERARVAADIHDDALQELTLLVHRLDAAGDTEGAGIARTVSDRLRAICGDLRLPILDDLGVGPALDWLVLRIERLAGGEVRLERSDGTRPPPDVELAFFRVAQEALSNAVKHGSPPIVVRYATSTNGASLSIDDAGPGIEPDAGASAERSSHFGLLNMEQRAEAIGAILDVRRWPAGGTHVALDWRAR